MVSMEDPRAAMRRRMFSPHSPFLPEDAREPSAEYTLCLTKEEKAWLGQDDHHTIIVSPLVKDTCDPARKCKSFVSGRKM